MFLFIYKIILNELIFIKSSIIWFELIPLGFTKQTMLLWEHFLFKERSKLQSLAPHENKK